MNTRMRNRYLSDSVTTASPGTLLVRLYDRLVVDLEGAADAARAGDAQRTGDLLAHAQDIIAELHATLRMDVWSGAQGLAQIYEFALRELIRASIRTDAELIDEIRDIFAPLRDAWREACSAVDGQPASSAVSA